MKLALRTALVLLALLPATGVVAGEPQLDPALRGLLAVPAGQVSGLLQAADAGRIDPPFPRLWLQPLDAHDPTSVEVILELEPGTPPPSGPNVSLVRAGSDRYGARLPLQQLRELVDAGQVRRARLSRPVQPVLDRSASFLGLNSVRFLDQDRGVFRGATGNGVVVGVVDSGVDWRHPDFQDAEGRTRIAYYWDHGFQGTGPVGLGYRFGTEWPAFVIDAENAFGADRLGHGTHVLGIAAGSGRGSALPGEPPRFAGVAPEATLIIARSVFTEFSVLAGVDYVFTRARQMDMPAVVNLSLGNHYGPHRGTTPFEQGLEELVEPGYLIVAAAGNSADDDLHAEMKLLEGETRTLRLRFPAYERDSEGLNALIFEGWWDPADRYRFTLVAPDGERLGPLEPRRLDASADMTRGVVRYWQTEDLDRGYLLLEIKGQPAGSRQASGVWSLEVEAESVSAGGEVDFWVSGWDVDGDEDPRFLDYLDTHETVIVPATAARLLSVGAVATRSCWPDAAGGEQCYAVRQEPGEVAFFSSMGPTSDGRTKPEILAPGYGVISTRASTISSSVYTDEELAARSTGDGLYWISAGTSMAAPQVTGVVALLLERYPTLTMEQARDRLVKRSFPGLDTRSGETVRLLHAGRAVAPLTQALFSEIVPEVDRLRIRWSVGKELEATRYHVYRGFSDEGPYSRLADNRIRYGNPLEIEDIRPESGREHVYRIVAEDEFGLEDELDTLRVAVPGRPQFVLRPPDPNPARGPVNLRYYFAPTASGGRYAIDVLDLQGRRIRVLEEGVFRAEGEERISTWDLSTGTGRRVPGGIYWVRMRIAIAGMGESGAVGAAGPGSPGSERTLLTRIVALP